VAIAVSHLLGAVNMKNTNRDRTTENRDPDNPGRQVVPPPQTPVVDDSAHVPGGATEMGEVQRALEPPKGGEGRSDKAP
jgi:hypothetical protein